MRAAAPWRRRPPTCVAVPAPPDAAPAAGALLEALEAQIVDVVAGTEQAAVEILQDVAAADTAAGRLVGTAAALLERSVSDAERVAAATRRSAEQVEQAVRLVDDRHRSVLGLVEDVRSLAVFTDAIAGVARATTILALNAKIEAVHAGAAGAGFAVVAEEVQALSGSAAAAVTALRAGLDRVGASMAARLGDGTAGGSSFADIEEALRQVAAEQRALAEALSAAAGQTRSTAEDVHAAAEDLAERTTLALGRLQFQDVVRQSLEAVTGALRGLRTRLLDAGTGTGTGDVEDDLLAELADSFVSRRQRLVHATATGGTAPAAGAPDEGDEPGPPAIELF